MNKKLFCFLVMLVLVVNFSHAVSIGVSPGRIDFKDMLEGGYAERTITISTNSDQNVTGHFTPGGEIVEWLRFDPNSTVFSLSKSAPYKLKVIAEPPPDVGNGTYDGSIEIITDRFGGITGRAGGIVRAAVTLLVGLEVINDEISECRAGSFSFSDVEIEYPMEFSFVISNLGNIRVGPLVSVDIWDQLQENLVFSKQLNVEETLPTVEKRVTMTLPNDLEVGQYWVNLGLDECGASDLLTFSVVEKGGIADKGVLRQISNNNWGYVGETIQITAVFENIGKRKVFAKFEGSIKLDDRVIEVIETDEVEVASGERNNFDVFFVPKEPGRYIISGRVVYNKKLTFERSSILNINPPQPAEGKRMGIIPLLVYIAIIITIIFIARKIVKERRRKRFF